MTKNSLYNEPIAKPSGITLFRHSNDVMAEAESLCLKIPSSIAKYKRVTHKSLGDRLLLVAKYHDNGKIHPVWQNACIKDYQAYSQWKCLHKDASFLDYSKSETTEAGKNLRKSGVRHEFYSLIDAEKVRMPMPLLVAIASHHAKLSFSTESRWSDFRKYWDSFRRCSNDVTEECNLEQICKYIYEYNGLRGLLQLADHRASAKEDGEYVAEIVRFTYTFPFPKKRGIQKLVEAEWDNDLLLVRAPTGAGKTDASLLWASKQIAAERADRLVIAMPTRFTANALAINVSESLSGTGIYHSSAWYAKYNEIEEGSITKNNALALHKMARLLAAPTTVTTIDHLLMSLTQTREDHHLINFNLANSCVVIDEADFYDDFTLANIQFLLKVLKTWEVPVMVMSASIPDSALKFYQEAGFRAQSILEDYSIDKSIEKFEIRDVHHYEDLDELELLLKKCVRHGNGVIYVNTVDKAIDIYNKVRSIKAELCSDVPIILYHSRFTEPDKAEKEKMLLEALGKDAWKIGKAHGIAILTQIGEISINISTDMMISDICPIDRLMQRVGRLCRFDNRIGELHVVVPMKEGVLYPAPYGAFNRKDKMWTPSAYLQKTLERLHKGVYTENDLLDMLNQVYDTGIHLSDLAKNNACLLQEYFKTNWLINSMEMHDEDESNTNFWRSRDIGPQDLVYTESPESKFFSSYSDFMNFRLQKSLALPMYLLAKIHYKLEPEDVYIANEKKRIYIVCNGFYNKEIGLKTSEDNEDIFL